MQSDRKWILLSFVLVTAVVGWVLDQTFRIAMSALSIENSLQGGVLYISTLAGFAIAAISGFVYFRQEKVQNFSMEVVQELKKVTWPAKDMTLKSTGVVIVGVIIISAILGGYDYLLALGIGAVLGI